MILDQIVNTKRDEVQELYQSTSTAQLLRECQDVAAPLMFHDALLKGSSQSEAGIALLAEVKKASPSKGVIREKFHPIEIASIYEKSGASAISVLTDVSYFQGSPDYLKAIRSQINLPILRKDFIIDEIQIPQTRLMGADAILLIVSILERSQLQEYLKFAKELGLTVLVEVHDEAEAEEALLANADLIGVNNRDLKNFTVDLGTTARVAKLLPEKITLVSESGIGTFEDVQSVKQAGAKAILVGESLMREDNIENAVHRLLGVKS